MTAKLYSCLGKTLAPAALIALMFNTSCSKKTNADDAKKFVATWNGKFKSTGILLDSSNVLVISAGSDGITATTPITVGFGSCQNAAKLTGTANEDVLTFPMQTVTDACGKTYQASGFASVTGDSISLTISAAGADSSGLANFKGKKS